MSSSRIPIPSRHPRETTRISSRQHSPVSNPPGGYSMQHQSHNMPVPEQAGPIEHDNDVSGGTYSPYRHNVEIPVPHSTTETGLYGGRYFPGRYSPERADNSHPPPSRLPPSERSDSPSPLRLERFTTQRLDPHQQQPYESSDVSQPIVFRTVSWSDSTNDGYGHREGGRTIEESEALSPRQVAHSNHDHGYHEDERQRRQSFLASHGERRAPLVRRAELEREQAWLERHGGEEMVIERSEVGSPPEMSRDDYGNGLRQQEEIPLGQPASSVSPLSQSSQVSHRQPAPSPDFKMAIPPPSYVHHHNRNRIDPNEQGLGECEELRPSTHTHSGPRSRNVDLEMGLPVSPPSPQMNDPRWIRSSTRGFFHENGVTWSDEAKRIASPPTHDDIEVLPLPASPPRVHTPQPPPAAHVTSWRTPHSHPNPFRYQDQDRHLLLLHRHYHPPLVAVPPTYLCEHCQVRPFKICPHHRRLKFPRFYKFRGTARGKFIIVVVVTLILIGLFVGENRLVTAQVKASSR